MGRRRQLSELPQSLGEGHGKTERRDPEMQDEHAGTHPGQGGHAQRSESKSMWFPARQFKSKVDVKGKSHRVGVTTEQSLRICQAEI